MPSFDIVSEIDMHEVTNAVDQAKRELGNRWDFKNVDADIELDDKGITISAEQEFQLEQLMPHPGGYRRRDRQSRQTGQAASAIEAGNRNRHGQEDR